MKKISLNPSVFFLSFVLFLSQVFGAGVVYADQARAPDKRDIAYAGVDDVRKLDLYLPAKSKRPYPVLIWFHGGGLTSGTKNSSNDQRIANFWRTKGVALVNVDYRLSPQVTFPAYLEDAAQAVNWVIEHAEKTGIDPTKIYVGGHSAGAYLTTMLALDERYLGKPGLGHIAGFISVSGQMTTHFTVRKERGLSDLPVIVDDAAPSHYVRTDAPRLLLLIGDHDWPARLEENQMLFAQFTQVAKINNVSFSIMPNRDHNSIYDKIPDTDDETYKIMAAFMKLPE